MHQIQTEMVNLMIGYMYDIRIIIYYLSFSAMVPAACQSASTVFHLCNMQNPTWLLLFLEC